MIKNNVKSVLLFTALLLLSAGIGFAEIEQVFFNGEALGEYPGLFEAVSPQAITSGTFLAENSFFVGNFAGERFELNGFGNFLEYVDFRPIVTDTVEIVGAPDYFPQPTF